MWFIFALIFALVTSVSLLAAKKIMGEIDEYLYLFLIGLFTIPFLFLIVISFYQIPQIDKVFLMAMLGSAALDLIAAICAYKAIRISEISLVAPVSAFNPVFTAIISFFTLGESITIKGGIGILLVCLGAYLLEISKSKENLIEPLRSFFKHRGVQLSLLAYLIWAVTPTLQKMAIFHTNPPVPPFASLFGMIVTNIFFGAIVLKFSKNSLTVAKKFIPLFLLLGILGAVAQVAAFTAFSMANLGSVTAIFKLSMIFTVIWGWIFLREHNFKERLLGSITMLIGVMALVI